jgi:hypothetical protein
MMPMQRSPVSHLDQRAHVCGELARIEASLSSRGDQSEQLHHNLPEMESSSAFKFSCIVTLVELAVSVGHLGFG